MKNKIIQNSKKTTRGRAPGALEFPIYDLEKSLEVINLIYKKSSLGMSQEQLAIELGSKTNSNKLINYLRSAYRYGMTTESYSQKNPTIKISELAKKFIRPKSPQDEIKTKFDFFQTSKLFKMYYDKLKGNPLPEPKFGESQIGELGNLTDSLSKQAFSVFSQNLKFLFLIDEKNIVKPFASDNSQSQNNDDDDDDDNEEFNEDNEEITSSSKLTTTIEPKVFMSHSKNKKILEQLKKILGSADIDFKLVGDKPETAISLKDKVFETVDDCNCGLVNISADDESSVSSSEDKKYVINTNVAIEIGALIATYKKNVVLLWDKRITIPTMLAGINRIQYEGDVLDVDIVLEIQGIIKSFKKNLNNK